MKKILIISISLTILLGVLSCERTSKIGERIVSEKTLEPEVQIQIGVFDSANLLSEEQEQILLKVIQQVENKIGSQIAIAIVDGLNGEKIEDFSLRKATELNLGRDDFNDGLLIAIAYKERKVRIEVGLGLQRIITNVIASQIITEQIVPKFKEQKYYEGIYTAVVKIKTLIEANKDFIGQSV